MDVHEGNPRTFFDVKIGTEEGKMNSFLYRSVLCHVDDVA